MNIDKQINQLKTYRNSVVKALKELRTANGLTQSELARLLDLSQARVSEIESGKGSLSAEQFLLLLGHFNIPVDRFVGRRSDTHSELQNIISRLGAHHLAESTREVPSESLASFYSAVKEVVVTGGPARLLTALAPVIVNHADPSAFNKLRLEFLQLGLIHRWAWVLDNTLHAVRNELYNASKEPEEAFRRLYRRAEFSIQQILSFPWFSQESSQDRTTIDPLDYPIRNQKSLEELFGRSSDISRKWRIASATQPQDFIEALRQARATAN